MIDLLKFYNPQNGEDFSGVREIIERNGAMPALQRMLRFTEVPEERIPEFIEKGFIAKDKGVLKPAQAYTDLFEDEQGLALVDGHELAVVLQKFEDIYRELKNAGQERRFGNIIKTPWKYDEIVQLQNKLTGECPGVTFAYLSDLYCKINHRAETRRFLERYERLLDQGLSDNDAMMQAAKDVKSKVTLADALVYSIGEIEDDTCALGLANKLAGDKSYAVLPEVCGAVVKELSSGLMALNISSFNAMDAYVFAAANSKAISRYVRSLIGCWSYDERKLGRIVKDYSDAANPNLEDIRARIREAM